MSEFIAKVHLGSLLFPMFYYIPLFAVLLFVLFAQKKRLFSLPILLAINIISCSTFLFFVYQCGNNATKEKLLASYKSGEYSKAEIEDILFVYAKLEKIKAEKNAPVASSEADREKEFDKILTESRGDLNEL